MDYQDILWIFGEESLWIIQRVSENNSGEKKQKEENKINKIELKQMRHFQHFKTQC